MSQVGWDEITLSKTLGDPWAPGDANAFPRKSEEAQATWDVGHDTAGRHLLPVCIAWARVNWNGAAYVIADTDGLVSAVKVGASTGLVQIVIADTLTSTTDWIACASPIWSEPAGAVEVDSASFVKDLKTTRVQLYKMSGGSIVATDASFTLRVYGVRQA